MKKNYGKNDMQDQCKVMIVVPLISFRPLDIRKRSSSTKMS